MGLYDNHHAVGYSEVMKMISVCLLVCSLKCLEGYEHRDWNPGASFCSSLDTQMTRFGCLPGHHLSPLHATYAQDGTLFLHM